MIPKQAVSIWAEGASLIVHVPGTGPEAKAHNLRYPLTDLGVDLLLSLLREREKITGKIASKSAPTKKQIEDAMKKRKPRIIRRGKELKLAPEAQQKKINDILERFGITRTKVVNVP